MMTKCHLLCALLVLALCCCPCVFTTSVISEKDAPDGQPTQSEDKSREAGPSGPNIPKVPNQDIAGVSAQPVTAVAGGGSGVLSNTEDKKTASVQPVPDGRNTGSTGSTGNSNNSVETNQDRDSETLKHNKDATEEAPNTTTTTTTTTRTTTTEAPSNTATNTEAPTTTTTRAPSRLREVDGSLSSSAWVCTPLVLAASALAYTALG
ncbi:putative mucin TcMUCII [Trypanosoma cruzi]|nr:putative mucin TcMUCII [Trypanosoma cruzi]